MNFTKHNVGNGNVESENVEGTKVPSGRYAQLLHDKTVELLKMGDHSNDFVVVHTNDNGVIDFGIDSSSKLLNSYWRYDVRLTPFTNYLQHRQRDAIFHNTYHASDAYVRWLCTKLQGKTKLVQIFSFIVSNQMDIKKLFKCV